MTQINMYHALGDSLLVKRMDYITWLIVITLLGDHQRRYRRNFLYQVNYWPDLEIIL